MSAYPLPSPSGDTARASTPLDVRHPVYIGMLFFMCFAFSSYLDR